MIPAHAVPWPDHVERRGRHDLPVLAAALDGHALHEPPPERRVRAFHPRVDDRDAEAAPGPSPNAHARSARPHGPWWARDSRWPVANGSLQAGRSVTAGTSRAPVAPRDGRGPRGSRPTRPTWPGEARPARATASARAHRPSPSSRPATAGATRRRPPRAAAGSRRPQPAASRASVAAQQLGAAPLRPRGPDPTVAAWRANSDARSRSRRPEPRVAAPVEHLQHADRPPSSTSGTARMERGT